MTVKTQRKRKNGSKARRIERPRLVEVAHPISGLPETTSTPNQPLHEGLGKQTQIILTLCAILASFTFAVYFRALQNPFVNYDDPGYVTENPRVQHGLTENTLRWALTSTYATNWHPLTWISHTIDFQLFGPNAAGHHLTSVLLHIGNVLLIFLLLARVTGSKGKSLLVALLFAIHPFNVESVAWISERKNVLCMFFILLTLAAYGWYARRPTISRYLAMAFLFVLALASKPMAVTLPFALLLIDFWPLQRVSSITTPSEAFPVPQASIARLGLEKLPLIALSLASSVITMIAQKPAVSSNASVTWTARFVNATHSYATYILKTFWPVGFSSFYPYEGYRLAFWKFLFCLLFLIAGTIWVLRNRSRIYLPIGWFWFLGTLVPMIGLVQVGDQAMADRYAYLPLVGIFVIAVWGIADLADSRGVNLTWRTAAASLVIVSLSVITWKQIAIWRSSRDLWFHALAVTKDNYMAEDYAGSALLAENFEKTGGRRLDEAARHFQNAVRINPNDAISHLNWGADLHERGLFKEAVEQYQNVLRLTNDPDLLAKTLNDLGAASQQLGDFAVARKYYLQAQQLQPRSDLYMLNLGKLGMAERLQELAVAASARPTPKAYLELGQLQQAAGQIPAARQSFEMAIKLNPKFSEAKEALNTISQAEAPARSALIAQ